MSESPYKAVLESPREGIIMQELHTYEVRNGHVVKTVLTRKFTSDDYTDSESSIPLVSNVR